MRLHDFYRHPGAGRDPVLPQNVSNKSGNAFRPAHPFLMLKLMMGWIPACAGMTALLLLAACTPRTQEYQPQEHAQATFDAGVFKTDDNALLPYRSWMPKGKPKAVVVAVHGFNDYSHAFEYYGTYFSARGVATYAYDQRGFGRTSEIGVWAGEENLVGDLKRFVELMQKKYPRTPVYIIGESMGGAVAIVALADPTFPKVQGVILSAPAVWGAETMNPIFRGTLWLAAHTFPYRELTGSDLKILASSNYPMLVAMAHDPQIIKATRVDAIYGMVQLMDSAYEKIPFIHTPTLLLYGKHDQVIPPEPVKSAITRFSQPVDYAYYPQGYHMLLRDLDRELVMKDVLSWIRHPRSELPSGFGEHHVPDPSEDPDHLFDK